MKSKDLQPRLLCPAKLSFKMEGQIKCFPDKVKLKEFIITKPLFYEMLKDLFKKKKIKTMHIKMATNSQLSTTESKKNKNKNKLSKQLEQEQNRTWRSLGGLSAGRRKGENMGQGTGIKKHKW